MIRNVRNRAIDVITCDGRQLLRAQRLPQQAQHDDDADEAGGHHQHGRRQADDREQQHHLDGRRQPLGAGPGFAARRSILAGNEMAAG